MFESLRSLFNTRRLDREEEADFRRCVLDQTDSQIEAAMGKQAAAQALADVESRQHEVQALRRNWHRK